MIVEHSIQNTNPFRLSIIEIDYHPEVLRNFLKAIKGTNIKATVYTTTSIGNSVRAALAFSFVEWIEKKEQESIEDFFNIHLERLNKEEAIFFNTLASNFSYFSKVEFKPPVILRLHNASTYLNFQKKYKPVLTPFQIFKDLSHFIRKELGERETHFRNKFIEKVDYFNFPDSQIEKTANTRGWLKNKKTFPPIPFTVFDESFLNTVQKEKVSITIIGSIDQRRRNYKLVTGALSQSVKHFQNPVELYLLGRPRGNYGQEIINELEGLRSENFDLVTYDKFVPEEEFERVMKETNFLIIPCLDQTRYHIYTEEYGKTKISGNIYDMIRFGKPALIPESYPVEEGPNKLIAQYRDENALSEILTLWVNNKQFETMHSLIPLALQAYKAEIVSQYIEDIF
ncbi:MAG: hypothetical protein ACI959_001671, partial [Limisphaerales bacterium]